MVASFGAGEAGEWVGEWLRTTMCCGHSGEEGALKCLQDAGFNIRRSLVEQQDDEDAAFLWIQAAKRIDLDKAGFPP